jgi:hypothetical protein
MLHRLTSILSLPPMLYFDFSVMQNSSKLTGTDAHWANAGAQQIFARIKVATDEAARTCQTCGQPGTLQIVANWRRTVCKEHRTAS